MARGDILALAAEKGRVVDRKQHAHRRLIDRERLERLGIFVIADRVADLEALDADQRADFAAIDALDLRLAEPVEHHQILDARLDHRLAVPLGERDRHARTERAARQLADGDSADVGRIFERSNQQLRRPLLHLRSGYVVDDRVQQRRNVLRALLPHMRHPALLGAAVNGHEVELLFGRVQREHQVEHLLVDFLGTAVRLVYLIDDDDRLLTQRQRFLKHEPRLRHRAFERIHEQQHAVGHVQHALHLAAEVGVARRIDDIDLVSVIVDRHVLRQDRDPALALQIVVVHDQLAGLLVVPEKMPLHNHLVDQRSLSVIDVGDDRYVAYFLHTVSLSRGKGTKLIYLCHQ